MSTYCGISRTQPLRSINAQSAARSAIVAAAASLMCQAPASGQAVLEGPVICWGSNDYGQCNPPAGAFTAIAAGFSHNIGLRPDGTVECWGENNHGQCNAPLGSFVAVAGGGGFSVGLRSDGTVECWGDNQYGQCNAPAGAFFAVDAGRWHAVGLRNDGIVVC